MPSFINPVKLSELLVKLKNREGFVPDIIRIDPIFKGEEDKKEFDERHKKDMIPVLDFKDQKGPLYLGLDAGSTTTKAVSGSHQPTISQGLSMRQIPKSGLSSVKEQSMSN